MGYAEIELFIDPARKLPAGTLRISYREWDRLAAEVEAEREKERQANSSGIDCDEPPGGWQWMHGGSGVSPE